MGVDEIFHGALVISETRTPGTNQRDYVAWSKETASLNLDDPRIQAALRLAAARHVVLTPTVAVSESFGIGLMEKHHMEEQKKFYAPQAWDQIVKYSQQGAPGPYTADMFQKEVAKNVEFVRKAHDAGCTLSTGTDYVLFTMLPGFSLWREMDLFAEAGLSPMEILKAATINGAYAIGRTDQLGSVEPGKFADFVVLNANPLDDISNVRQVWRVVKGGVIYDPQELYKPLAGKVY